VQNNPVILRKKFKLLFLKVYFGKHRKKYDPIRENELSVFLLLLKKRVERERFVVFRDQKPLMSVASGGT